ncbi:hypothetical protein CTEN210_11276 [Chaetoceros tenuissimus]|uniref:Uncharacterized protein n=1 Tax=Chaetoceros tenuissimus TaxID=426638 RepID=A0AAD3H8Z8_9STRA|nr:hypothetical protein CTEN210_11276 [Chaetoceros tenuissimus]
MGIFVSSNGNFTLPFVLLLLGIPLIAIGKQRCIDSQDLSCSLFLVNLQSPFQWTLGVLCLLLSFICIILDSVSNSSDGKRISDEEVETELLSSHYHQDEILDLIQKNITEAVQLLLRNEQGKTDNTSVYQKQVESIERKAVVYLNSLAFKVSKQQQIQKMNKEPVDSELNLLCQEAAYKTLVAFDTHDKIVSSSISLLALVAKDEKVQERTLYQADRYGLDVPIKAMRDALARSKLVKEPKEENEFVEAELQRKACLLLGALADGAAESQDLSIVTKITEEDGLEAIIDAIDWYRLHAEVCNWGLWALFTLCFGHRGNKKLFVRMQGIQKSCEAITNIINDYRQAKQEKDIKLKESTLSAIDVARHGVALLFDVLRYDESDPDLDIEYIRSMSLNGGLHKMLISMMNAFSENKEIMMMAQQMLIATGYCGNIPEFAGSIVLR